MKKIRKDSVLFGGKDDKWNVAINRRSVTDSAMERYKDKSIVKAVVFENLYKDFSYDRRIISIRSLRHTYHGQTYIIYPFKIGGNFFDGYNIRLLTDGDASCNGCFVVSKRDVKSKYPQLMRRTSTLGVKTMADTEVKDFVNEYSAMLGGGFYNVRIDYEGKRYDFDVISYDGEDFVEKVQDNTDIVDDDFDRQLSETVSEELAFDKNRQCITLE